MNILTTNINHLRERTVAWMQTSNWRQFARWFLFLFLLYFLASTALIRANVLYEDDQWRAITGGASWELGGRYLSNFLALFFNIGRYTTDTAPLPQYVALALLALTGIAIVYLLCNKEVTYARLFATLPVGLSPYFLECLSYRFDAAFMAVSIIASVVPFLWWEKRRRFFVAAIIGVLATCLTYQASSGIFIMLALLLAFSAWLKGEALVDIFSRLGLAALAYLATLLFYKLVFMGSWLNVESYTNIGLPPLAEILPNTIDNLQSYYGLAYTDSNRIWLVLIVIVGLLFLIRALIATKHNRISTLGLGLATLALMALFAFGVFPFFTAPLFQPRAMLGFGVLVALVATFSVGCKSLILKLPQLTLSWCLLVFALTYGNLLYEQQKYDNFRNEILAADLGRLYPDKERQEMPVTILGNAGHCTAVKTAGDKYPVVWRSVYSQLREGSVWVLGGIQLTEYYSWGDMYMIELGAQPDPSLPTILDSYYHTIQGDDERIIITLKDKT
jgi:hypothetical protein